MASIVSCDNESPFSQINSENSFQAAEGLEVAVERCPLCSRAGGPFYCSNCVNSGVFSRSNSSGADRFLDIQKKWDIRNRERLKLVERLKENVAKKEIILSKLDEIEATKEKVSLLKSALHSAAVKTDHCKLLLKKLTESNRKRAGKAQHYIQKREDTRRDMRTASADLHIKEMERSKAAALLCHERREAIKELCHCIFPVEEMTPTGASSLGLDSESLALSTVTALKEACQMAYMSGHWVMTDHNGETFYKIVDSILPGNGDYSVAVKKDSHSSITGCDEEGMGDRPPSENQANAVLSALSHTTHAMLSAANILHVFLPSRICFSEFCYGEMHKDHLQSAVSRLNLNMLHLCFSQGVNSSHLAPRRTLYNLLVLLQTPRLARDCAFTVDMQMLDAVADGIPANDSDGEKDMEEEWVRVERRDLDPCTPEIMETQVPTHDGIATSWTINAAAHVGHMTVETQSTASNLMTSAAASFASLWRAAAGHFDNR